tara:strand:+ start:258 stop:467 length:210 start_codon:yes stop_codon:yes gene_type:complete
LIFAPKFFRGSVILEKSLFDKLLSPTNFIFFSHLTKRLKINLPRVPEFPAFIIVLFLGTKPFKPQPLIS